MRWCALVVEVAVAEDVVVARFLLDGFEPVAEATDLVVFRVGVAEVAGQDVTLDGIDACLGSCGFVFGFVVAFVPQILDALPPSFELSEFFVEPSSIARKMFTLFG